MNYTMNNLILKAIYIFIIICISQSFVSSEEDYYELLGIRKDSTNREIRKAFKKLALIYHPDKNKDDPLTSEKFLKINKAYEVLKDEDLRKKYDLYGEEGLQDNYQSQGHYQSWTYYHDNFGIYDDDPEIITLSKSDFENSVLGTSDLWFINFYSGACSHCHTLAPTWRELARELEDVIRFGAVNCEDDWLLCRQQGIYSYPSLIMYPKKEKYSGDRTTRVMMKYILNQLKSKVTEIWDGNFKEIFGKSSNPTKPWIIIFCGDDGDCPSQETNKKIAALLSNIISVGQVDCIVQRSLCDKVGFSSGIVYFSEDGKREKIESRDAKEIYQQTLKYLPEIRRIDAFEFQKIHDQLIKKEMQPWVLHFVSDSTDDNLELRKLSSLIYGLNIGELDCSKNSVLCQSFHIQKFGTIAVFKLGGGHEIYHGRTNVHDIAAFVRESISCNVQVLGPSDFPGRVIHSDIPWLVDFHAPWCHACVSLMPELRKASRMMGETVQIGTVDCTIHHNLCSEFNIRSYPTTILYNQTVPHHFYGHNTASNLKEFIQDTLSPPVVSLTFQTFESSVVNRQSDQIWLVDFFAPWCGPCKQLSPQWRKLAKMMTDVDNVNIAQVDCTTENVLCNRQNVQSYPSIRLYPAGSTGGQFYHIYNGWERDAESLQIWIYKFIPSQAVALDDQSFLEDVIPSSDAWIVDFYAPWCSHCHTFAPEFETVLQALKGKVKGGKVDCEVHHSTCQQAGIGAYPTVRLYLGTENQKSQDIYGHTIHGQESKFIIESVSKLLKLPNKAEDVHDEL